MINSILSQSSFKREITDFKNINLVLEGGTDITPSKILWFNVYKSSDFPEITCDKVYFFLYSTDHDSSDGGIFWGKADNLDCSDFQEVGLIVSGYQAETPALYRFTGFSEKIFLYYHTGSSEPGNNGYQQTRLITTNGGELHNTSWTDRGRPLGILAGENHTGYCKVYKQEDSFYAIHLTKGGLPPEYKVSSGISPYDISTRDRVYDLTSHIPSDKYIKPSYGSFFYIYDKWFFIGTIEPSGGSNVGGVNKNCIIAESNENYEILNTIKILNNGDLTRNYECRIYGDVAHIYFQNPAKNIYYATIDLSPLKNY